ncbi:amidase, putative, partial [Ixodes scapularis]
MLVVFLLELLLYAWRTVVHALFRLWFGFTRSQQLPPVRNKLLLETATQLADKIRRGEVRSSDVVQAYIERISQVQPLLNAVVADRFDDALREAALCDQLVRSGTRTPEQLAREKPLLGVPFTAKNSVAIKGMRQDAGSLYYREQLAQRDAAVVRLLRDAGAIPLALTNVPELCMWGDTYNRMQGVTSNPYDTRRTPGGSSGT